MKCHFQGNISSRSTTAYARFNISFCRSPSPSLLSLSISLSPLSTYSSPLSLYLSPILLCSSYSYANKLTIPFTIYLSIYISPLSGCIYSPVHNPNSKERDRDREMPPTASTRWSPTPEQLMILEELYRREIKTPTASQIQHITSHLSLYGKIEGKNVFYWFQNHKARDRQKLRRKLLRQQQQQQQHQHHLHQHQIQHHGLLHHIQSPPFTASTAPALLQLPTLYNQTHFLPQGGESSNQMIMIGDYGWNMIDSSSERVEIEKPNNPMYGQDWMMMMMMDTRNIPCCTRPPKTLQLFPIATNEDLPDDCIASSTH